MTTLYIRLFGQISLQQNDRPLVDLPAKALELLCYLLIHRERAHTREALAEVLWPETSVTLSQKYLRQTLWQLQAALEAQHAKLGENEALLLHDPGWIRANPACPYWIDVKVLEEAYTSCLDIPGHALSSQQAQALVTAVELYQGDLLETWYQDWSIYERERLQLTYLALLDKLVEHCIAEHAYGKGIDYGQRILRCDPARESTYQQLMRLHYLAGDRTTALREYKRCTAALAREFGVQPSARTIALYEQIQADQLHLVAASVFPDEPSPLSIASEQNSSLAQELEQLQASFDALQAYIQQELATIVHLLENQQQTHRQTPHKTR